MATRKTFDKLSQTKKYIISTILTGVIFTGCSRGLIYTDIVVPKCLNLRGTQLGDLTARASSKRLRIPTTTLDLTADWDSRAIGDVAKRNGMATIYGCDERVQSFVFGTWERREILVYGSAEPNFSEIPKK